MLELRRKEVSVNRNASSFRDGQGVDSRRSEEASLILRSGNSSEGGSESSRVSARPSTKGSEKPNWGGGARDEFEVGIVACRRPCCLRGLLGGLNWVLIGWNNDKDGISLFFFSSDFALFFLQGRGSWPPTWSVIFSNLTQTIGSNSGSKYLNSSHISNIHWNQSGLINKSFN